MPANEGQPMPKKLRTIRPKVQAMDVSTTRLSPKVMDPLYNTRAFIDFRAIVLERAGYRCEAVDSHGHRCERAGPEHRLYADHIRELVDGGSLTDPANGQCLCASHHELKTLAERARRHRA